MTLKAIYIFSKFRDHSAFKLCSSSGLVLGLKQRAINIDSFDAAPKDKVPFGIGQAGTLYGYVSLRALTYFALTQLGILDSVAATAKAEEIWLGQMSNTQYIAWRYIATAYGILRIYPGVQIRTKTFNPVDRPW